MKKALVTLSVGCALVAFAAPAFAQSYDTDPASSATREAYIRDRITDGMRDGEISYDQAGQLRSELRQIVALDNRYQDEGMSDWQARDISSRLSLLDSRLHYDLSMSRGGADNEDDGY